jgi:hypothetical protein
MKAVKLFSLTIFKSQVDTFEVQVRHISLLRLFFTTFEVSLSPKPWLPINKTLRLTTQRLPYLSAGSAEKLLMDELITSTTTPAQTHGSGPPPVLILLLPERLATKLRQQAGKSSTLLKGEHTLSTTEPIQLVGLTLARFPSKKPTRLKDLFPVAGR